MKRYLAYLKYVIRHKGFVFLACAKTGILWEGIIHDWSKFRPSEFIPYARHFYNFDGSRRKQKRDKTGYYKPTDTGDPDFDFAWLLHQKRNKHHWQWWTLPEDEGGLKILRMQEKFRKEMLADWRGAGMAQGKPNTLQWYKQNRNKMQLHSLTRERIEQSLGVSDSDILGKEETECEPPFFETVDGKWHKFCNGIPCRELTDEEAANVIWGTNE